MTRVKKNELGLLYELTLSYRESDDIEIVYAHGCVDFTVVWYDGCRSLSLSQRTSLPEVESCVYML